MVHQILTQTIDAAIVSDDAIAMHFHADAIRCFKTTSLLFC